MRSILATGWRVVIKRAAADRLTLAAAVVTIMLATTLLAAGPIYYDAVALSGAQRALADAPLREVNLEISLRTPPRGYRPNAEVVAAEVPETFGLTGAAVFQTVTSGSYDLPTQASEQFIDVAVFQYLALVEEHATILEGRWPDGRGQAIQAAVSESTAVTLGLGVGDQLVMRNRADRTNAPAVEIAGIFRLDDPRDPFWFEDPLMLRGVEEGQTFRTFGPFVVDLEAMFAAFSPSNSLVSWRVFPEYGNLEVDQIAEIRRRVGGLETRLNSALDQNLTYRVETRLPQLLGEIERSVQTTRTGVLTLTAQLSILAAYALILTAGLLVESRRTETDLLRTRGASSRQIFAMAVMEGIALTVPAAVAAPWLAAAALRALNRVGPLASIDLVIDPVVSHSSYLLAFLAATGCVIALAIPAFRSARSFNESYVARGRQQARGILQQGGIDLALLTLAGLLLWQLQRFGPNLTASVQNRLGIDPLLIAAPAIAMLAGAVLALRSIPLIARLAERGASVGPSAVRALAAWQVARRPGRHARAALLLIMALGIGVFAAGYTTTWKRSQAEQADHQVGADIRIEPNQRLNDSIPELNLDHAHSQIEALVESMPVARESGQLSRAAPSGRFLLLDASTAAQVVTIRNDLSSKPFAELMDELAARRPALVTVPIPGEPRQIGIDFTVDVDPVPEDFVRPDVVPEARVVFSPVGRIVVQDAKGLLHRIELGAIPVDQGRARVAADLTHPLDGGVEATPSYPLSLVEIELSSPAPFLIARTATVTLDGIFTKEATDHDSWREVDLGLSTDGWTVSHTHLSSAVGAPAVHFASEQPAAGVAFAIDTGVGRGPVVLPVYYGLRRAQLAPPELFPVVVSTRFLETTGRSVGDEIELIGLRGPARPARIVGSVAAFPTVDPNLGDVVLIDLPTFQMLSYSTGVAITGADERWIRVDTGQAAAVAAALDQSPYDSFRVLDRADRAETLQLDPVALGTIGSLTLAFVAAAVFAASGFAVSAVVAARERLTEFALLRALGLSTRQLADWLSLEHGVVVALSILFGSAVGLLMIWIILPLIVLTQTATRAVPEVIVVYPWVTIVLLEAVLGVVLGAVVLVLVAGLRRTGLGTLLGMVEE